MYDEKSMRNNFKEANISIEQGDVVETDLFREVERHKKKTWEGRCKCQTLPRI